MALHDVFFSERPSTEKELAASRHGLIAESSIAVILTSLASGNFLAGYLSYLGASVSFCAFIGALPQFGCVLQLASPFLFERLRRRKLAIGILCFFFRFCLGFSVFAPLLFPDKSRQFGFIFIIYFFSYLAAGFVTPGLQQLQLDLAPVRGRGSFFARKDIAGAFASAAAALVMGWQLDHFTDSGSPYIGYLIVGGTSIVLSCIDIFILFRIREQPAGPVVKLRLSALLEPLKNQSFRPIVLYCIFSGIFASLSSPFLSVHQLRNLHLTHTFITSAGVLSMLTGMLGTWLWGRIADRSTWDVILRRTALISAFCTLGWAFVTPETAKLFAPVLLAVSAGCGGSGAVASMSLQYACSPPSGKTLYLGVTSASASLMAWISSMVGAGVQPLLEGTFGASSIPLLYFISGIGALLVLATFGRKLPQSAAQ